MNKCSLCSYLSGESSNWVLGISDTGEKVGGAIRVLVEVTCGRREARGIYLSWERSVSHVLSLFLCLEQLDLPSTDKTLAWITFCLELVLVAHHFCKLIYRMLWSPMRFIQITTKPIHCSELAGDNKWHQVMQSAWFCSWLYWYIQYKTFFWWWWKSVAKRVHLEGRISRFMVRTKAEAKITDISIH